MPVQRLLKYPLFFRELLELVAQAHPARDITLTLTHSPHNLHHSPSPLTTHHSTFTLPLTGAPRARYAREGGPADVRHLDLGQRADGKRHVQPDALTPTLTLT
eukprot:scaffold45487_cov43-Phaeocystis_antarctica.AAC.3